MNDRGESTVNSQAEEAFGILCSVKIRIQGK
jgi:hypothetical protein